MLSKNDAKSNPWRSKNFAQGDTDSDGNVSRVEYPGVGLRTRNRVHRR